MATRLTEFDIENMYEDNKFSGIDYGIGEHALSGAKFLSDGTNPGSIPTCYSINMEHVRTNIVPKLRESESILRRDHALQCQAYLTVLTLSDIHADFRKFVKILKDLRLIRTELDPYTEDIYNPLIISDIVWTGGPKTLLMIVGDVVDGQRIDKFNVPDPSLYGRVAWRTYAYDNRGSFEFLLLAFLYNLRISANEQTSEVLFTIGNHDLNTVIRNDFTNPMYKDFYNRYVTESSKFFFGRPANRRECLIEFYRLCPFFIVTLVNKDCREVAFVHGGLHSHESGNDTEELVSFQTNIDNNSFALEDFLTYPRLPDPRADMGPLWTRYYSQTANGVCDNVQNTDYKLIVVGHCPTPGIGGPRMNQLLLNPEHSHCDNGMTQDIPGKIGCVLMDCKDRKTKLLFVDTALAQGFRWVPTRVTPTGPQPPFENSTRDVQILRLIHDLESPEMFYNRVETIDTKRHITHLYTAKFSLRPFAPFRSKTGEPNMEYSLPRQVSATAGGSHISSQRQTKTRRRGKQQIRRRSKKNA